MNQMDLNKIKCKKCKYYRNIYIHPWSKGVDEKIKSENIGYACMLFSDKDFLESFNGRKPDADEIRVNIMLGRVNGVGCECFAEVEEDDNEV